MFNPKFMKDNDDIYHYFTGLSWSVFDIVYSYIKPYLKLMHTNIPLQNQVIMVLLWLRINLPFEYKYCKCYVSKNSKFTIYKVAFLIHWQDRDIIRQTVPPIFKQHFPKLTIVLRYSLTDLYTWKPITSLLELQKTQYSQVAHLG